MRQSQTRPWNWLARRSHLTGPARTRFVAAAFLLGSAIFGAGCILFAGGFAGARGFVNPFVQSDSGPVAGAPSVADPAKHVRKANFGGGQAVCVRLCDGFYFPSVILAGGDQACAEQCPDAPTAFYSQPAGSDSIDNAVSLRGEPYSGLPVAHRHESSYDETCTCHRSQTRSYLADLLNDRTLRDGDLVMMGQGFTVFRGGKTGTVSAASFVNLERANLSKASRDTLTAMERAGAWDRQFGPYSSTPSSATSSARTRKGIVTVDDGPADPTIR